MIMAKIKKTAPTQGKYHIADIYITPNELRLNKLSTDTVS